MDFSLEDFAHLFTTLGVLVAAATYFMADRRSRAAEKVQKEILAKELFSKAIALAIKYPELSEPVNFANLQGTEFNRYQWFVGYFLNSFDEILEHSSNQLWLIEFEQFCTLHKDYMLHPKFLNEEINHYSDRLAGLTKHNIGIA